MFTFKRWKASLGVDLKPRPARHWAVLILIQQGDLPSAVAYSKQPDVNLQILPRMHFVKFSPVNQIDQTAMLVPARVSGVRVNAST